MVKLLSSTYLRALGVLEAAVSPGVRSAKRFPITTATVELFAAVMSANV